MREGDVRTFSGESYCLASRCEDTPTFLLHSTSAGGLPHPPSPCCYQESRQVRNNLFPCSISIILANASLCIGHSSNERLLESSLLALTEIFSRVKDLNGWQLFHDLFSFLCMLLDPKMAKEAGKGSSSPLLIKFIM